jgi:hypothetical protein
MRRILTLSILILIVAVAATACGSFNASPPTPNPYGAYEIDPIFWSYFNRKGGVEVFGQVLTTIFTNSAGEKLQYLESGLLVYNPAENRFYFAPLGIDLKLGEPPNTELIQSDDLMLNGYLVHPKLVDYYLDLGRELVGAPISNPHYNYAKKRLEQHFENLGLYYMLDDPEQTPHLLAYGLLACSSCQAYPPPPPGPYYLDPEVVRPKKEGEIAVLFRTLGIPTDLRGDLVMGPVLRTDGSTEMVYEHMAFRSKDGHITIQPIPSDLGYSGTQRVPQIESPLLFFIPMEDNLGHNILKEFHNFILENGGYEVAGAPTTEIFTLNLETAVIRQCFTNYCLDYLPDALEAKVRPAQLGKEYLIRNSDDFIPGPEDNAPDTSTSPRTPDPFTLHVWESNTTINSSTPQTISATVFSQGVAQSGQNLELYITMPDGTQQLYYLPTTNENGRTGITIPPIDGENGSMIQYRVCLSIEGHESICVENLFMIWGNP